MWDICRFTLHQTQLQRIRHCSKCVEVGHPQIFRLELLTNQVVFTEELLDWREAGGCPPRYVPRKPPKRSPKAHWNAEDEDEDDLRYQTHTYVSSMAVPLRPYGTRTHDENILRMGGWDMQGRRKWEDGASRNWHYSLYDRVLQHSERVDIPLDHGGIHFLISISWIFYSFSITYVESDFETPALFFMPWHGYHHNVGDSSFSIIVSFPQSFLAILALSVGEKSGRLRISKSCLKLLSLKNKK